MDNKLFKVYEDLPSWSKGVVVVGGLAVVTIVGFSIYNKIKNSTPSQDAIDAQQRLNQVNDDINIAILNGQQATFSSTQYNNFADTIASSFSGCDWTSPIFPNSVYMDITGWSGSGSTVYNIFKQFNNDLDCLALEKAFKTRTIKKSWVCGGDYKDIDLSGAVNKQLNQVEINGINDMLSKRNISFRF